MAAGTVVSAQPFEQHVPSGKATALTRATLLDDAHSCRASRDEGQEDEKPPYRPMILMVDNDATIDTLMDFGCIIYHRRDDMLLASVPRDTVLSVLGLEGLVSAAINPAINECLDVARPFGNVEIRNTKYEVRNTKYEIRNTKHEIRGTKYEIRNTKYEIRGTRYEIRNTRYEIRSREEEVGGLLGGGEYGGDVVVGFSDVGFDAQHIAFRGRIGAIYNYDTEYGVVESATTDEEIAQWQTDTPDNYHATHVGNILAGGHTDAPYYGVARDATIVATTSRLHDVGILSGVEDIIAYGKALGAPTVINLSLSSHLGPHDGTDLLCRYLSSCAKDAVICISAGNNGSTNCFASQNLWESDAQVIVNNRGSATGFEVQGATDLWSDSEVPFEMSVQVYDTDLKTIVYSTPWQSGEYEYTINAEDAEWSKYMTGYVIAAAELCPLNNRYNATVAYETQTVEQSSRGPWARYYTCINVRQRHDGPDVYVSMYSDAASSILGNVSGAKTRVSSRGSINDMCCADGVIAVGMANDRDVTPTLDGEPTSWGIATNQISRFSAYSDVPFVERLPHISAPGAYVVSAMSSQYMASHPDTQCSAVSVVDGKDYYWFATSGTSMAAPFVAGCAALWLQVNPLLTSKDIIDIAQATARRDFSDIDDPRWGAGCIDCAAGLEIAAGIDTPTMPTYTIRDGQVTVPEGTSLTIYTIDGRMLNPSTRLRPGIYILSINGHAHKVKL